MKKIFRVYLPVAAALAALTTGCSDQKALVQRDAQSIFDEAARELEKKHCLKAAELFQKVVINFPGSALADDAQFRVGEARFCAKEYTEAVFEYQRLIDDYPNSPLAADSRYKIAACYAAQSGGIYLDQTETKKALAEYQRFIDDHPGSSLAPDAQKRIAEIKGKLASKDAHIADNYLKWGYAEAARVYYQRVLDIYGDTPWAEVARLGLALVKVKKGEIDAALEDLKQLVSRGVSEEVKKQAQAQIDELRKRHETSRKDLGSEPGATGGSPGGSLRPDPQRSPDRGRGRP